MAETENGTAAETDPKFEVVNLGSLTPDPRVRRACEAAYRRGVSQALSVACDVIRRGGTGEDLAELTDLSMAWRYDRSAHGAYLGELLAWWRRGKKKHRAVRTDQGGR